MSPSDPEGAAEDAPRETTTSGLRLVLSFVALIVAIALLLFPFAGRLDWVVGWVWIGTIVIGLGIVRLYVVKAHPDLPSRRRTVGSGTPKWDRTVLAVFRLAVVAVLVLASLDGGRYGWSSLPTGVSIFGVVLIAAGLALFGAAAVHNPFFESTVRIQSDLDHRVASTGPYRAIRHPGYAGLMLLVLGTALLLGSVWALIPVALGWLCLLTRTALEDRFLQRDLDGYAEYATRVPYRLIPRIW